LALVAGGGFEAVNGRRLGGFAPDSPLEGSGFELSVPRQMGNGFEALSETSPIGYPRRGLIRAVAGFAEYPD
jgi:hypothetical protein